MSGPRVSVLMPVLNAAPFLDAAIASIIAQTWRDFELIIVDGGSTDGSAAIVQGWMARDERIRAIPSTGRSLVADLNLAAAAARGDHIARMDADDVSLPRRLSWQMAVLDAHPEVLATGGQISLLFEGVVHEPATKLPTSAREVARRLVSGNAIAQSTVVMRRSAFADAGGYREGFCAEDYDLWLRLSERGDVINLDQTLIHYRLHPAQLTSKLAAQAALSVLVSQACSRARRRGVAEPPLPSGAWDAPALVACGIDPVAIARALTDAALSRIATFLEAGITSRVGTMLDELERARGGQGDRRLDAGIVLYRWWLNGLGAAAAAPARAGLVAALIQRPRLASFVMGARRRGRRRAELLLRRPP